MKGAAEHLPVRRAGPGIAIVYPHLDDDEDAISHHAQLLGEQLRRRRGAEVTLGSGRRSAKSDLARADAVLVEYNPFAWGRRGFAPYLIALVATLRARRAGPTMLLIVHETAVPLKGWRWTVMGLWQRFQLELLRLLAHGTCASIQCWAERLGGRHPRRPTRHLPAGSSLADMRGARAAQRNRLGVQDDDLVVAVFGRPHPWRVTEHIEQALVAIQRARGGFTLLNLGAGAPKLVVPTSVRVCAPGSIPREELAARLAAADLFLGAWRDGASTRRTTLLAAMQHGLAPVCTEGTHTDALLRAAPEALELVPVGRPDRFASAAAALASRPEALRAAGAAARALYDERLSWPVIADGLVATLDECRARR
jgi:glycosyltransferase involved in cell wall biosynthesis